MDYKFIYDGCSVNVSFIPLTMLAHNNNNNIMKVRDSVVLSCSFFQFFSLVRMWDGQPRSRARPSAVRDMSKIPFE